MNKIYVVDTNEAIQKKKKKLYTSLKEDYDSRVSHK